MQDNNAEVLIKNKKHVYIFIFDRFMKEKQLYILKCVI